MLRKLFNVIKGALTTFGESDPRPNTYLAKLFHKPRYDNVTSVIRGFAGDVIDVLIDVGCGRGVLREFLLKAGVKVGLYICCDVNKSYLREIEGESVQKILCDAQSMPLRGRIADLVICSEVLEHLGRPFRAVLDIFHASKKNVLITFPDEVVKNALGFKYPEHISEIDFESLTRFANRLGYEVKSRKRLYFAFPPSIFDRLFSFSYRKLRLFSSLLAILSSILRGLCLIKTEVIFFVKKESG